MKNPYKLHPDQHKIAVFLSQPAWFHFKTLLPHAGQVADLSALLLSKLQELLQPLNLQQNDPANDERIQGLVNSLRFDDQRDGLARIDRPPLPPYVSSAAASCRGNNEGGSDVTSRPRGEGPTEIRRTLRKGKAEGGKGKP